MNPTGLKYNSVVGVLDIDLNRLLTWMSLLFGFLGETGNFVLFAVSEINLLAQQPSWLVEEKIHQLNILFTSQKLSILGMT